MQTAESAREERRFLLLVLLGGLALRLIWLVRAMGPIDGFYGSAEATQVALAVARGDGIADAYYQGYGPTAHLLPASPAIAGFWMWLFGPGTSAANIALLGWCLAQVVAAWLLLRALFRALDADPRVTRWGMALLCLAPAFAPQEAIDFRYWEGASALALAALNLLLIVRHDAGRPFGWRALGSAAALWALTFFICPPAGLATAACWAVFALRRLPPSRRLAFGAASALAAALLLAPWALRNQRVLGAPVLLRSNFGLEFAIANHPAAISGHRPEYVFASRLAAIHPYGKASPGQAALRAAGGEVAYSRALGAETWRWAAANPWDFARLSLRHLREFFFPRPWQMYFTGWEGMRAARAYTIALVNLLGLIGLAIGLWQRRRGYWVLAVYLAVLALPYALLQPMSRYIYLAYGVLAFLAIEAVLAGLRYAEVAKGPGIAR
ncbi:MAG: hypothetical protein J7500_18395 [Sphingomonas sp.]|uniref:hypothetical protein n=1 Tax=Sphingomonas sp. TaxID=28214 RepID=UPI001B21C740|nr:hypothetical protein [Sphingomonas sp.]MBO9624682.1 hypothetical protein [Sphingomonas sp.]